MQKIVYKYITIIVIVLIFSIAFAGTHSVQSVDDLAYAVAIGIDKRRNQKVKSHFSICHVFS